MFGKPTLPVVGGLVFRPDGSQYSTGSAQVFADTILQLGALESDCCDIQHVWTREYDDLPGFGRLYVEAIFDDSCMLKNLPRNARFPLLGGNVILACYLDVYKLENQCCVEETLVSLSVLDTFGQKAVDALVKGHTDRTSNTLDLTFDKERIMAAFEEASMSKWGKVFPVDGAPYSKSKTPKSSASDDTASSSSVNGPSESKPSTTSKPRKATLQAGGKKGQSSFAANLQKAFG